MSESLLRLHFLLLLLLCSVTPSSFFTLKNPVVVPCHPHKIQAFTEFKNEFDTRGCNRSGYSNGVWCDNLTGAVTKIRLRGCLIGTLKPNSSLFGFHQLRYLDLAENSFTSASLPSEFGKLSKLEVLFLSSSGFHGQVPSSFSDLTMLSSLDLSSNELTGSFPLVRNLRKLSYLNLSYNHLSGTLDGNSSLFGSHHLRYLDIGYNNFSSSLPSEFGNLNKLEVLYLTSSGFSGKIFPTISNLTQLTKLHLFLNKFTGSLPLVQNLTKLSKLGLGFNQFTGTIPSYLLTLPSLSILDLRQNHLSGSIKASFNSSTSSRLEIMYLGDNQFDGKILEPISKLINLKRLDVSFLNTSSPIELKLFSSLISLVHLDLSGNSLSPASLSRDSNIPLTMKYLFLKFCGISQLPTSLRTLENLEYLQLSNNEMRGKIPEWLWSLPCLRTAYIRFNSFNGFQGSAQVLVNSSLRVLFLDANNFEGRLPDLPLSIKSFSAQSNSFEGEIPLSICNRSSLASLVLIDNNFSGPIPQCLSSMVLVSLRKNNFQGSIPNKLCTSGSLRTLDVSHNRLTGKLPRSLVNCSSLEFISVANNRLEDTFPFWLKALPNLQVLTLRSNKFYGPMSPPHQGPLGFPELQIFEIADNKFTGSLPPNYFVNWKTSSEYQGLYKVYHEKRYDDIGYTYRMVMDLHYKGLSMETFVLTSYIAIDFSGNRLEGQIPESIGLLKALIALNLSNNAFTGHIPLSLANLEELESLDMSRNKLSGTIPNALGTLSFLEYINVSHNHLKGEIPQGPQITGQSESSFEGNAGLCGLPLKETCFGGNTPPTQQPKEKDDEEEQVLSWKAVAIGYGSGVLLGLVVAQVIASYKPEWLAKIICLNKRRNR
ncbi:hypothetical protein CARUB_v10025247mg [Capsella rubella]|uniref:Leucine-rich repeat-containing N-terminal plant-type domain-containing protein n=2 Tax=Capsella rubella TaxID=81985 RepID=R0HY62_9BRAS|nr:hypothetical protein CARUB_v10025247mg [Capsella rubella]